MRVRKRDVAPVVAAAFPDYTGAIPAGRRGAVMTAERLFRLRQAHLRAIDRRRRADELATCATMRLSDAEEAEVRARGRLARAEHEAGMHVVPADHCAECRT